MNNQMLLFDTTEKCESKRITDGKEYTKNRIILSGNIFERLNNYSLNNYVEDVQKLGLEKTWDNICEFVLVSASCLPEFFDIDKFGELYETGLAIQDKILKKKSGQYYTPDDVSSVMCEWLEKTEGENVCDVGCGTGKLILTYLDLIGYSKAVELISNGKLYLYDCDNVALKICRTIIAVKYGLKLADSINDIFCDFLDKSVKLPENSKVICNPPYYKIDLIQDYWNNTSVLSNTKELYAAFMEKIFAESKSAVIITPFSFISGAKFYSLRTEMCRQGNGFIVSFDNVPGNIFKGKKHGIFNSNTSNSVRAAITVFRKDKNVKGFKVSPLLRFKNEERKQLLKCDALEKALPERCQIVDETSLFFKKLDNELIDVFDDWTKKSQYILNDVLAKENTEYLIDMPNTCRYFTTACSRKLNRTGSITMHLNNEDEYYFLYCMINSSFVYWWWRIFDGGITYPIALLNNLPLPINLLTQEDKDFFKSMAKKLICEENDYIITKMNAGVVQENIKFPEEYRESINSRILLVIGNGKDSSVFKKIHSNKYFN